MVDRTSKQILEYMNAQLSPASAWCGLGTEYARRSDLPFSALLSATNRTEEDVYKALDWMAEEGLIEYRTLEAQGTEIATAFTLTHKGLRYKEFRALKAKEKWKERLWGFLSGVAVGVAADWLIRLFIR